MSIKRRNIFVRLWWKIINPILRKIQQPKLGYQNDFQNFMYEEFDGVNKFRMGEKDEQDRK